MCSAQVSVPDEEVDRYLSNGPQSTLEKMLIEAFLEGKGYSLEALKQLPAETASQLMREACSYASIKLAEVESKAQLRQEIHYD